MAPSTSRHGLRSARSRSGVQVRAEKCLIVNTKGGGHAFIGLHLARKLMADGHSVTLLNDGDKVGFDGLGTCWVLLGP